jgi:hypothetical protein
MNNQFGGGRGFLGRMQPPTAAPYGAGAGAQALNSSWQRGTPLDYKPGLDRGIPTTAGFAQGLALPGPDAKGVNPLVPTGSYGMSDSDTAAIGIGLNLMKQSQPQQQAPLPPVPQQNMYAYRGQYAGLNPLGLQQPTAQPYYRGKL